MKADADRLIEKMKVEDEKGCEMQKN